MKRKGEKSARGFRQLRKRDMEPWTLPGRRKKKKEEVLV